MYQSSLIGVDTIRFIATLTALEKELSKLNLEYDNKVSVSLIQRFKKEVLKKSLHIKRDDFELEVISISKDKSLLGYMLVKKNYKSISQSVKQKRAKDYKREIIFTGLNQPTKKHHKKHIHATYEVIKQFVRRFKVDSFDISIDGINRTVIQEQSKAIMNNTFLDVINYKSDIQLYEDKKTGSCSYYINNPYFKTNRFSLAKLLIYNKYAKDGYLEYFGMYASSWKRLELTIKVNNEKLTVSLLDKIIESIKFLSDNYFVNRKLDDTLLQQQKQLLKLRG